MSATSMVTHDSENAADAASGELFILSAPSAVGKTTLIRRLLTRHQELAPHLAFSVSHTSRPPRAGEVHGEDYYFVERSEFERLIAADAFLEWAVVHDEMKGTSHQEIDKLLATGKDVILDLDVQGARHVLESRPHVPSVFILPPSYEEMERRLRCRGLDDQEQIERRLVNARREIRCYGRYEYVIVNDDVERASEALAAVFLARRCRRDHMQSQIERVLEGFPLPDRKPLS